MAIPTGAIRYNTDSNKMECFDGTKWWQIAVSTPDLNGGTRGVFPGGGDGSNSLNTIDYITISAQGNGTDFGDLATVRTSGFSYNSRTRGIVSGGEAPSQTDSMEYFELSSGGTGSSFGSLTQSRRACSGGGFSNATRGCGAGGYAAPAWSNVIDYVTMASTGDAVDFGDTINLPTMPGSFTNGVRGVIGGGQAPSTGYINVIQYVTMATTGNALDFGDLTTTRNQFGSASNNIIGLWACGADSSTNYNIIDYVTIMTLGNSLDWGDSTVTNDGRFAAENRTRAVWAGGYGAPNGSTVNNVMDYTTMTTKGDSVDFGDMTSARGGSQGMSNGRGGL